VPRAGAAYDRDPRASGEIAERYRYSIYDSLIIVAALHAGASVLYSEDMRDAQTIDGLTIRNPF
jgi:predicted nucleic acid-binding protein